MCKSYRNLKKQQRISFDNQKNIEKNINIIKTTLHLKQVKFSKKYRKNPRFRICFTIFFHLHLKSFRILRQRMSGRNLGFAGRKNIWIVKKKVALCEPPSSYPPTILTL